MVKTYVTISLDSDVAEKFNLLYKGEMSTIVNALIKTYIKYEKKQKIDDIQNELSEIEKQKSALEVKEIELKKHLEMQNTDINQQKIKNFDQKLIQEKVNYPIIEKEFMDLLNIWELKIKEKFTNEWANYLDTNNLMPNDCNRVQYWFRFYKSEGKTYE